MQLQKTVHGIFLQLTETLTLLTAQQFNQPSKALFDATIGQHTRHIIEMFICLEEGYEDGIINYENRRRDVRIETDKAFACSLFSRLRHSLEKIDKPLLLMASYNEDNDNLVSFQTNYLREIAYNIEHAIHHMALIKIGINDITTIPLPDSFGVATSTIKHRKECAQ